MFEKKLIEELLGITKPWRIEELVMEAERQTIVVRVSCGEEVWGVDGKRWHIQGWEVRRWRHLDLWQLKTEIEARVPQLFRWTNFPGHRLSPLRRSLRTSWNRGTKDPGGPCQKIGWGGLCLRL